MNGSEQRLTMAEPTEQCPLIDVRRVEPSKMKQLLQDQPADATLVICEQQLGETGEREICFWPTPANDTEWEEAYEDYCLEVQSNRLGGSDCQVLGPHGESLRRVATKVGGDTSRPQLAMMSPLPPERSGISDYIVALIPALCRHYELILIHPEPRSIAPVLDEYGKPLPLYTPEWLDDNAGRDLRIIYHVGNSPFHEPMLSVMRRHPGVVMLHDYFLSHLMNGWCLHGDGAPSIVEVLQHGHGYPAVQNYSRQQQKGGHQHLWQYSLNLPILQMARGILVHSPHSQSLAEKEYNPDSLHNWHEVPMLSRHRQPVTAEEREVLRQRYGLRPENQLICSFGYVGPSKLSLELIKAFAISGLAHQGWRLFLAGSEGGNQSYRDELENVIKSASLEEHVHITGWISSKEYWCLQEIGSIHVQLRTKSRGETSAAVMDCLRSGAALIVNRHGSLDDLPDTICRKIADQFTLEQLAEALVDLSENESARQALGEKAKTHSETHHTPEICAKAYRTAIEEIKQRDSHPLDIAYSLANTPAYSKLPKHRRLAIINGLSDRLPAQPAPRRLYVDVSAIAQENLGTGIQRVTTNLCRELMAQLPPGWVLEPVQATPSERGYKTAPEFAGWLLGLRKGHLIKPERVMPGKGDLFLGLDLYHAVVEAQKEWYEKIKARGTQTWFVVYDLLPCQLPEFFPTGTEQIHKKWLETVTRATGAVCISKTVADDLGNWMKNRGLTSCEVGWFHQGADLIEPDASRYRLRLPSWVHIGKHHKDPELLMVGTIEPRKGYLQVLQAMEQLWREGATVNLTIIGREGWRKLPEDQRRTLPATIDLMNHLCRKYPQRLSWLKDADDGELQRRYETADTLIAASYGEGFGLPLVEARHHGLNVIARDLPIFREVMGNECQFFTADDAEQLADFLREWSKQQSWQRSPSSSLASQNERSDQVAKNQSWKDSCQQLLKVLHVTD